MVPQVLGEGEIQIQVGVELNTVTRLINGQYPLCRRRSAWAEMRVKDAQPIVVEGLRFDRSSLVLPSTHPLADWPARELILVVTPTAMK